jgi:hypothetical protein
MEWKDFHQKGYKENLNAKNNRICFLCPIRILCKGEIAYHWLKHTLAGLAETDRGLSKGVRMLINPPYGIIRAQCALLTYE